MPRIYKFLFHTLFLLFPLKGRALRVHGYYELITLHPTFPATARQSSAGVRALKGPMSRLGTHGTKFMLKAEVVTRILGKSLSIPHTYSEDSIFRRSTSSRPPPAAHPRAPRYSRHWIVGISIGPRRRFRERSRKGPAVRGCARRAAAPDE